MNQKLLEIKTKIQDLIDKAVNINNQQKTLLNFLFSKLEEVKELETLERLSKSDDWFGKYLNGYLLYKSISRANYQPEHLELTKLDNIDKCLEVIEKDVEANQPKETKPKEISNQQLLIILGERIEKGEIRSLWSGGEDCVGLSVEDKNGKEILSVDLDTGKIIPDPAQEFLKKHGIKEEAINTVMNAYGETQKKNLERLKNQAKK